MMMRGLLAAAALMLLPGAAAAQDTQGKMYVEGRGGVSFVNDSNLDDVTVGGVTFESDFSYDTGWLAEGAFGYAHMSGIRPEVAISYRKNDFDEFTVEGGGASASANIDGDISALTYMANLYYDFNIGLYRGYNSSFANLTPFIGAGLGAATVEIGGSDIVDDDDTVFAWQLMAGLAYDFTPNFAVTVTYNYFVTSDPEFGGTDLEYDSHNVLAGLRFSF